MVQIKNENTCFDYIEREGYHDDGSYFSVVFVEPIGNLYFTAETKESMKENLERIFNSQPIEYDYIKAGHLMNLNMRNISMANQMIEDIKEKEIWDDSFYLVKERIKEEITEVEEIYIKINDGEKLYLRINDAIHDERMYRDGLIIELKKIKPLGRNNYLMMGIEDKKNDELGIERTDYIHDLIISKKTNMKEYGLEVFLEKQWIEKKEEYNKYKKYQDDMGFDEFLEKIILKK